MIGLIFAILLIIGGIMLGLSLIAFWIWMLVDAIKNPGLTDGSRVAWVLVIVFLHLLGAIIYFFAGRSQAAYNSTT